jgi:hypothetical protein
LSPNEEEWLGGWHVRSSARSLVTGMSVTRHAGGPVRLLRGRFEAQFDDVEAAQAAARDARAVGFVVDVEAGGRGWLAVARRQLPFPDDERDRYASRFDGIARQRGGAFTRFVEEPPDAI